MFITDTWVAEITMWYLGWKSVLCRLCVRDGCVPRLIEVWSVGVTLDGRGRAL